MMICIIVLIFLILFFLFNNSSLFYREKSDLSGVSFGSTMEGAESFESIQGNKRAIMFIHGFPGSPKMSYLIRDMASKSGYDVFCPKLPGFGSDINDLIKTNFSMWFGFIKEYYLVRRSSYDEFYIAGNSMGGALSLKLSMEFPKDSELRPTAVASVAAPVFITNPLVYVVRTLSLFTKYIPPKYPQKGKEQDVDGETEWIGYRGKFPKQIFSLLLGLKVIKKDLKRLDIPCYLCHAKEDKTVSFKNLYYIAKKISSKNVLIRVLNLGQFNHSNHSLFIYKSVVGELWSDIDGFFKGL